MLFRSQKENLPIIDRDTKLKDAIIVMSDGRLGNVIITEKNRVLAVLSDGDLRRAMMREDFSLDSKAISFATENPKLCYSEDVLAHDVLRFIEESKIQFIVVTDEQKNIKGAIHIHTLVSAGIR